MRISHRHRFVFFSNPKTGSSSVRQMLDPHSDFLPARNYLSRTPQNPFYPHMPPIEARQHFQRMNWPFEDYTRFTFVRNPWARLVSLYTHICAGPEKPRPFPQWIYTVTTSGEGGGGPDWQKWRRFGSWSIRHYIGDDNGAPLVDRVLRLEDIETALPDFLAEIGVPDADRVVLLHRNRRNASGAYANYYNPATRRHVERLYEYDIETFKYRFE